MKRAVVLFGILVVLAGQAAATIHRVPTEYPTIYNAMSTAQWGDEVVVEPGLHAGGVWVPDGITLRSTDPTSATVVEATIIDGDGTTEPVVRVGGTSVTLAGLTIRNGGGIVGSQHDDTLIERCRVIGHRSSAISNISGVLRDNLISSNTVTAAIQLAGGGVRSFRGVIVGNRITSNSLVSNTYAFGGGLAFIQGVVEGNEISGNSVQGGEYAQGGGLYSADHVVGNVIANNIASAPTESGAYGGGACSVLRFERNLVVGNHSNYGGGGVMDVLGPCLSNVIVNNSASSYAGGIWSAYDVVMNNTIVGNSAGIDGGAVRAVLMTFNNNIIHGNTSPAAVIQHSCRPHNSCVQADAVRGRDCITTDPLFVDAAGLDFRLRPESPCIDAGTHHYLSQFPLHDKDGLGRLAGGAVDMGACEHGSTEDADGDLLSDLEEAQLGTDPTLADTDDDGLVDFAEIERGTSPVTADAPTTRTIQPAAGALQRALFTAVPDDVIVLTSGTYAENVHLLGKRVVLAGEDPLSDASISATIIDGGLYQPIVAMDWGTTGSVFRGLTLRRGSGSLGAIMISSGINYRGGAEIVMEHCRVHGSRALPQGGGASIQNIGGVARNCIFYDNTSQSSAGWPILWSFGVENCTIHGNSGGLYLSDTGGVRAVNSIIWNSADGQQVNPGAPITHSCILGWTGGGTGNISTDPALRDPLQGDFHLTGASPCRNAGSPVDAPPVDYEGDPRSGLPDIGADEYLPNDAEIEVTGGPLSFGNVPVGVASAPRGVIVGSTGLMPLEFTGAGFAITGPGAADFGLSNAPSTDPLAPGTTRTVEVVFTPSTATVRLATLVISHNDHDVPDVAVPLVGRGIDGSTPHAGPYNPGSAPGVSTIGPGGDHATLYEACEAINNLGALTGGDWTFEIIANLTETNHVAIGQETGGNTITFRPAPGIRPTITFDTPQAPLGYPAHWVIGSPRVVDPMTGRVPRVPTRGIVIDGSNTPGGVTRDLTITNTPGATGRTSLVGIFGDSDGNTVRNCRLVGRHSGSTSTFGVVVQQVFDLLEGVTDDIPDHNVVENNEVVNTASGPAQGFWVGQVTYSGAPVTTGSVGNVFRGNDIAARARGFFLSNAQEVTITSNTIRVNQLSASTNGFGLLATDLGNPMTSVTLNISSNNFTQLNAQTNYPTGGYGVAGIQIEYGGEAHTYNIWNNMIGGLKLTRTAPSSAGMLAGIRHSANTSPTLNILHNSISILGSDVPYSGLNSTNCMGIGITGAGFTGTANIRNNVFRIAQPGGVAVARLGGTGVWNSDHNDMSSTAGALICRYGGSDYATLAQWQALTGQDMNSRDIDPTAPNYPFAGRWTRADAVQSDLHFNAYPGNAYAGVAIHGIDTDIDGDPRDPVAPYMGADELTVPASLPDADGDGTADVVEGSGDGNGDGIPDALQANVGTIPNSATGQPVTVVGDPGTQIINLTVRPNPAPSSMPPLVHFPVGFFAFTLDGLTTGAATTVRMHLPPGTAAATYHKYGPRPGQPLPEWYDFTYDGTTGAERSGDILTLHLVDGGRGDSDLTPNGRITDPGGPVFVFSGVEDWRLY